MAHPHQKFLNKFDNAKQAAADFGVTVKDISHWKRRGIPARLWPTAESVAKKRGWTFTALTLARAAERQKAVA